MERNIQKNGFINLLTLLVAGVAALIVARLTNSLAGQIGSVFLFAGTLVAGVSWFQMRLEERERLEVRWSLLAHASRWNDALPVAQALLTTAPNRSSSWLHHAYTLRRAAGGGLQQAWDALLPAHEKFPREATIAFNLSCYACQLNQLEEARSWFHRALKLGGKDKIKAMALADSDMQPLWEEIRQL